ncbi:hypothetical protein Q9Q95_02680 [Sphingomonas sp. DG1-23]|uniref:hypothetical protein n=1 Tax=Sphingomonas sp. DG1-23 TaxID=3068316 RepID=UPI00273DB114|nr:hypothetical protein [Sphingomonas sp. DG1-23]MDP5277818.1 hypothetical protein [Sphingomonas sp. DG1-23]
MEKDRFDLLGPLLSDVGGVLATIAAGDPEGVFLYVEIGDGWISPNIFKDEGELVRWLEPGDSELIDLLYEAWHLEPKGKRWSVMEYDVKDGKFAVSFKYPEEVDVESMDRDRREDALVARYGDKPVIYPPLEDAFEL